ncbi:hypothetical protein [Tistrella mobilis]|uniref:hypothetical protein n=1 Tax=Tistrella mobilis TaxID=171437 RepID=UPI00355747A9
MSTSRLDTPLLGAIAGVMATVAMTAAMRRMRPLLPEEDSYPLPPREIIDRTAGRPGEGKAGEGRVDDEQARRRQTLLAHFAFGAASGAVFALLRPRGGLAAGAGYGVAVWAASYLGWIPAARILKPATRHPWRRNLLMIAAHLVWGASLAKGLEDLDRAEGELFEGGPRPHPDQPHQAHNRAGPAIRPA